MNNQAREREIFAYNQGVRRSLRRGNQSSKIMRLPFKQNLDSQPMEEKLELNSQRFEGLSFKLLS